MTIPPLALLLPCTVRSISNALALLSHLFPYLYKPGTSAPHHCATLFCDKPICSFSSCTLDIVKFHVRFGCTLCIFCLFVQRSRSLSKPCQAGVLDSASKQTQHQLSSHLGSPCTVYLLSSTGLVGMHLCRILCGNSYICLLACVSLRLLSNLCVLLSVSVLAMLALLVLHV